MFAHFLYFLHQLFPLLSGGMAADSRKKGLMNVMSWNEQM